MVSKVIRDIVDRAFPTGSEIVGNITCVTQDELFWVIPGNNGPRWLIPQNKRYGHHAFKQWKPYDLLSQIKWKLLYGVYCTGQLGLIPGITSIGISSSINKQWKHLGWMDDAYPVPIIYIGTSSPTQKAVLSLVNSKNNRLVSVAKVPLGKNASINILHEYESLNYLFKEKRGFAPQPYFANYESGYSNQECVHGRLIGRKYSVKLNNFLSGLKTSNKTSIYEKSKLISKKLKKLDNIDVGLREIFFDAIKSLQDTTKLTAYHVHGDFVPWNIIKKENDSIVALDWEAADLNGLPLYDFFYFHFQQNYLFDRKIYKVAPYGVLVENLSNQTIEDIKKYTLVAMALEILSVNGDASYFVNELRNEV